MNKVNAMVNCSVLVNCPKCQEELNLLDWPYDDDGKFSGHIFNNEWGKIENKIIYCSNCKHKFKIDDVEQG